MLLIIAMRSLLLKVVLFLTALVYALVYAVQCKCKQDHVRTQEKTTSGYCTA